jgi:hypothetical protein
MPGRMPSRIPGRTPGRRPGKKMPGAQNTQEDQLPAAF